MTLIKTSNFPRRREPPVTGGLRFERKSRRLSILRLSDLSGVSRKRIQQAEVGRCLLGESERAAIAAALEQVGPSSISAPRHMRLIAGLRLRDIAERTGLSESVLSLWERSRATLDPREEQLVRSILLAPTPASEQGASRNATTRRETS